MLEPDPALVEQLKSEPSADLPRALAVAEELAGSWGLTLGHSLPGATCSLVFSVRDREGRDAVLKVPVIGEEATSGYAAALAFVDHGGVGVWAHDAESGALLMPKLTPGTDLHASGMPDLEAVDVAASAYLKLRRATLPVAAPGHRLTLESWLAALFATKPTDYDGEIGVVQSLARQLLETTTQQVLLHGDLHHFNLLLHGDRWVAIDPKGVVGDPAFEVVAFMRNPIPELGAWPDLKGVQEGRLVRFSELLDIPIQRLWGWSYVETFLSAVWSSGEPWCHWHTAANALRNIGRTRGWL